MSQHDQKIRLEAIAREVQELEDSPLYDFRVENNYQPVIGEGDPQARVMLIGEAPGKQEARSGRPFVGRSGKVLDKMLESIGLSRQNVYITNVVKDRPPENRDPTREEVRLYAPFLDRQIDIIQPQVIVPLGRFAMQFVLDRYDLPQKDQRISELHGAILEARAGNRPIQILPMFHPAVALYNPDRRQDLQQDFQTLADLLANRS